MNTTVIAGIVAVSLAAAVYAADAPAKEASAANAQFGTTKDKVSYIIGFMNGSGMQKEGVEINPDVFFKGMQDGLAGKESSIPEADMRETMSAFQKEMMAKMQEKRAKAGEQGAKDGAAFLAANKKKDGVKTTKSGLQYKVITAGKGPIPKATDTVVTHYRGTFINGKEFDSSYKRGEPATFPVTGVIKGWTEALQLMPIGSKWQLYVPAELGYGERGAGSDIPPNSALIFDIELLGITNVVEKMGQMSM